MFKKILALVGLIMMAPTSVNAATLLMNSGELAGASGVNVNGTLYDVSFFSGSCASVYGGCDTADDFTFQTVSDADAASSALLGQVLINIDGFAFDDSPELTLGCTGVQQCQVNTAYAVSGGWVDFRVAFNKWNIANEDWDSLGSGQGVTSVDPPADQLWAKWTVSEVQVVPVPAAAYLFGSALLGLIGIKRKK